MAKTVLELRLEPARRLSSMTQAGDGQFTVAVEVFDCQARAQVVSTGVSPLVPVDTDGVDSP